MSKQSKTKFEENVSESKILPVLEEVHYLSEHALYLRDIWSKEESPRDFVPPQTPNSEYGFEETFCPIPKPFPDVAMLEVPYVREKGVLFCIEHLGTYFGCKQYKFNLLQYWFLDVITDCLWRSQDDFKLPVDLQKIVLKWVLYFIDILRDEKINISRKQFFTVFKEAISVAAEIVDEGCDTVPTPENVFALIEEEPESEYSFDSESTTSSINVSSDDYDNVSCVELEVNGKHRMYELPSEFCTCDKYDLSSVDTATETETLTVSTTNETEHNMSLSDNEEQESELSYIEFYQSDPNIPARFLPFPEDEESSQDIEEEEKKDEQDTNQQEMCIVDDEEEDETDGEKKEENLKSQTTTENFYGVEETQDKFDIKFDSVTSNRTTSDGTFTPEAAVQTILRLSPSKTTGWKSPQEQSLHMANKQEVLKGLAFQKLWEQRFSDMANPKKGWVPTGDDIADNSVEEQKHQQVGEDNLSLEGEQNEDDDDDDDEEIEDDGDNEWVDITLKKRSKEIEYVEDKQVVNFGVLWAIIDFIFKYFYESFQFSLIKLAFQATPEIITQKVNEEWRFPKIIKGQLIKPKTPKQKKAKQKKKKPAKGKKDKGKKKKAKSDKKAKKKKEKKSKTKKPKGLTKEQKKELERLRREELLRQEELMKLEEQKRYMFPLTEAADDDFYKSIFENWVKVDLKKKGGKGKGKGKGKKKGKK